MSIPSLPRRDFLLHSGLAAGGLLLPHPALGRTPPPPESNKKFAAICTAYHRYSHADNIITRFIEGYSIIGKSFAPPGRIAALYIDQVNDADIGRPLAHHWDVPLVKTIREALTLGGDKLAVDGVVMVAEHGDYPTNDRGQKLYPRRQFFEEIVRVFRQSGRSVPVFTDKHLSWSWENAKWMYDQSKDLNFPLMAGSSIPVTHRRPDLRPRPGVQWEKAVGLGYGHFEVYGFHTLEGLQVMAELRRGGETGVRAVQCLEGKEIWEAARAGKWDRSLLEAAIARCPTRGKDLEKDDANAHLYLIEYRDGFNAAAYVSSRHVAEFGFAGQIKDDKTPASCWYELPKPQRDHFSFLTQGAAQMMLTGKATTPVERTLLTGGMLTALMESKATGHRRIETPHLDVRYNV